MIKAGQRSSKRDLRNGAQWNKLTIMPKQKPRITSAVLVIQGGKFLLAERNKENYKGYWIIPGGGVKFGESIQDAAVREIKEETNIDVEIKKLIGHKEIINVPKTVGLEI